MKQAATVLIPYKFFHSIETDTHEFHHVLGVSRKDNKTAFGFPGGKVDDGETPEEAAKRELYEETGIIAHELLLLHNQPYKYGYHEFTYIMIRGTLPESFNDVKEAGVVKWCSWNEIINGPFSEYNSIIKNKLIDYEQTK